MQRLHIVLFDIDYRYVDRLADFINTFFSARMQISAFTKLHLLEDFLRLADDRIDILLTHPQFLQIGPGLQNTACLTAVLCDDPTTFVSEPYLAVDKFQPADKMILRLIDSLAEKNSGVPGLLSGTKNTKLISVFSPAGGVGKTSIALGLASELTMLGSKVLLMSLESMSSISSALNTTGNCAFTHIMLSLMENSNNLPVKIEMHKTKAQRGFYYVEPPECFLELADLGKDNILALLSCLRRMNKYDAVIIDLDAVVNSQTITALSCCDRVILVQVPDPVCKCKVEEFLGQIKTINPAGQEGLTSKLVPVINKSSTGPVADLTAYGLRAEYAVPVFQNLWNCEDGLINFDSSGCFSRYLQGLAIFLSD